MKVPMNSPARSGSNNFAPDAPMGRKKRRWLSLSLAGCLVASLLLAPAGCGQRDEPAGSSSSSPPGLSSVPSSQTGADGLSGEAAADDGQYFSLYKQAVERLRVQAEEGSLRCGFTVENDSGAFSTSTSGSMAVSHGDGLHLSIQTQTETGAASTQLSYYSDGQSLYRNDGGQTQKQPLDQTAADRMARLIRSYSYGLIDPAQAGYEHISAEEATDGNLVLTLSLSSDQLASVEEKYADIFGSQYKIVSMELEAGINPEGDLRSAKAVSELVTTAGGQVASYTMTLQMTFSDLGAEIEILPPDGLDPQAAQETESFWS